jgi:hypothetical protein
MKIKITGGKTFSVKDQIKTAGFRWHKEGEGGYWGKEIEPSEFASAAIAVRSIKADLEIVALDGAIPASSPPTRESLAKSLEKAKLAASEAFSSASIPSTTPAGNDIAQQFKIVRDGLLNLAKEIKKLEGMIVK